MKVAVLSNTNIDPLLKGLQRHYELYKAGGYNNWASEILDEGSGLYSFEPDAVFILLDGTEIFEIGGSPQAAKDLTDQYWGYLGEYAARCAGRTLVFVSNIDIPAKRLLCLKEPRQEKVIEGYWQDQLNSLCARNGNMYCFDLKGLVEALGRTELYSGKLWYLGGIRYSLKGQKAILEAMLTCLRSMEGHRRKCIVLDLDNTLWGGLAGEDGLQGIELSDHKEGARFRDFQKRLKDIKDTGIILAIASKNNFEDAVRVLREHKGMYLRESDFAAMKINWDPKTTNLEALARELNIGLDSMVFIDDNPVEREAVRCTLPEVAVPDFPQDSADLEDYITRVYKEYFFCLDITEEDRKRTDAYVQNTLRERELKASSSMEEYLQKLQTIIKIWKAGTQDIGRLAQLIQKTNQFNLTTKRYAEKDITGMIVSGEWDIYMASVEDRFGDNGKSIVLIARKFENSVEIDTFLMSCRIMGRYIEDKIIAFIEKEYREQGFSKITAEYIRTSKNTPVSDLYDRLGYDLLEQDSGGNKRYKLELDKVAYNRKNYGELIEL